MRYKTFKNLSDKSKEEWLFNKLQDRVHVPFSTGHFTFYFSILNYLMVTVLALLYLAQYDNEKFSYLIQYVQPMLKSTQVIVYAYCMSLALSLFNICYLAYKEYKLIKRSKKHGTD